MERQSFSKRISRRKLLQTGAGALGLATVGIGSRAFAHSTTPGTDVDGNGNNLPNIDTQILNYALNLEYLEAEFLTYATTGAGIEAIGLEVGGSGTAGPVTIRENAQVPFVTPALQQMAVEFAQDERNHVRYLRQVLANLGAEPIARPAINLSESFSALAQSAGLVSQGQAFDPFADEVSFLLGAFMFEDVGVTAYRGAAPRIINRTVLSGAAGILAVEGYHAGSIRTTLYNLGVDIQQAANRISDFRDAVDGMGDGTTDGNEDRDQGVAREGGAVNVVPSSANGLAFKRQARQVLNILYLSEGATQGGFFPNGINTGGA